MNHHKLLSETFIDSVRWLHEIDSTNTYLIANVDDLLASDSLPLLIGSNRQTGGRGRGKNTWWAGDGALTFSLLLRPKDLSIRKDQWPMLSLTVGLSVCLALQRLYSNFEFRLKWPNDVFANGRKICGVLNETLPNHPELLVIGVGVNVNNSLIEAPIEIQERAASLTDLSHRTEDVEVILVSILKSLQEHCQLLGEQSLVLTKIWKEHCYLTGMTLTLVNGTQSATGTCVGIDDDGALRLLTESGEQRFLAGVVQFDS